MNPTRPPIGLMPRKFWDEQRQRDISEAINRYLVAGKPIPAEWVVEYNVLASEGERR